MRILKTSELREMGIIFNRFEPSSPSPMHNRERIEGRNGYVDLGTVFDGRTINAAITILPINDYAPLRDKVFDLFDSRGLFYIVNDEEHKRWLVKHSGSYTFARKGATGETAIQFESPLPYADSIGTTLEPITFRSNPVLLKEGLYLNEKDYKHSTNTFKVFNVGEKIDPRELPLKIHFKGASNGLSILNNTNGTEWSYNDITVDADEISLDGIRSFKNGISIFRNTNYGVIELEKGWNEFTISGATNFEVKFDHRFYYL